MKIMFASLLALSCALSAVAQTNVIDYRFDEVRRKVIVASPKQQVPAVVGLKAQSGDRVETGWFAYALIASEVHRAKFEIFSSTKVELASNEPGMILSLERGKLHAIFDKITGNEPRVVKTPGALLAVRGTQYTVEVGADGSTRLDVHEGIVEVRSPLRPEPLFVHAGEFARYSRQRAPEAKPMPLGGHSPHRGEGSDHPWGGEPDGHGTNPPSGGHGGHGSPGSGGMMPPPSPPPSRPPAD